MIQVKKFFQGIGIISLLCFSFIYTEKTVTVVKEFDDIMIKIKSESELYKTVAKDAIIQENTIIPGISGSEIDINKSYSKMKRYGKYNENLLEYVKVVPNVSLSNNINKCIISGNKEKDMVSLLFLIEQNDSIDEVMQVLDNKNVYATFFLDGNWVEKNNEGVIKLVNAGHEIGNLGYNYSYSNSSFLWLDNKLKKVSGQNTGYCYHNNENDEALILCAMNNNYSIKPSLIVNDNPTITIKENIVQGDLIALKVNDTLIKELPIIINFIKTKGFDIVTLDTHLQE